MQVSITCDHTVEDVVFLLKRNWFFDTDDLYKLCWELPDRIWKGVVARMNEYPVEIQNLLLDPPKMHTNVREMTDAEYNAIRFAQEEDFEHRKRAHKARFFAPPRPRESADDAYDRVVQEINEKHTILKDITKSWKRQSHEPLIKDTEHRMRILQNEFETLSKQVESLNKTWTELKWLDAVLQDAAKGSI